MVARLRPLFLLAALLLVTQQFWLFPEGMLPSPSRDMKVELLPALMAREQLSQGEFPWSSPWYAREPNLSIAPWSLFYPGMMLMVALPTPLNVRVYLLLHILIGFGSMLLLLRRFVREPRVAEWGALVYLISGHWAGRLTSYHYELIAALAWVPLVFYAFHRICCPEDGRARWRPPLLLALLIALLVYDGAMYALTFVVLSLAVLSLALLVGRRMGWHELRWLGMAALLALVLSAPKLIPSLMTAGRQRPPFSPMDLGVTLRGLVLPGQAWWRPGRGIWDGLSGAGNYISLATVVLAAYGVRELLRVEKRAWGLGLLLACALLLYWGLGFPPFGMPALLAGLRTGMRVQAVLAVWVVLYATVGLDALLAGRQRVPWWLLVAVLLGFGADLAYTLVRGYPELARALGATERQLVLLYAFPWQVWRGWLLALAGSLAVALAWYRRGAACRASVERTPRSFRRAEMLAAVALFCVMSSMAADPLQYETDPLRDASLLQLRDKVEGSVVGLAGFGGRDVQDRVLFALAGHVHLLNPNYSSLGQEIPAEWLEQIDYVVSGRRIRGDLTLPRTWYPFDTLATLPSDRLALVGKFQTENPYTREDLSGTKKVADLPTGSGTATLWLYRVRAGND